MSTPLYQRNANVDISSIGERIFAFGRATKRAILLNASGVKIWPLLQKLFPQKQLTNAQQTRLAKSPAAQITTGVEKHPGDLKQQDLVVSA